MTFDEVLAQVLDLLRHQGRVSYRALKRRFALDDEYLEDLKAEPSTPNAWPATKMAKCWSGRETPPTPPTLQPEPAPLAYTPPHLTEKILASRPTLEGERKQVTVLFADIKDSTELIKGLDPEAAQQLLDPAIHRMMDAVHRFEGTVNQVLGDGLMALFGAPIAHEDHAARACYAAWPCRRRCAHTARRCAGPRPGVADPRRPELRRGGGACYWQRPAYGLFGRGGDYTTWQRAWNSWLHPGPSAFPPPPCAW